MKKILSFFSKTSFRLSGQSPIINYQLFILILIFIAHIFLRFYEFETRNPFGWDQVDNAWVAKDILIDHKFPLLGMVAKQNSGFNVGPIYYYFITFFYWVFNLDPKASGIFAGLTSIFTFFIIYYLTKKLFSINIALIAVFIHTFSFYIIGFDRIQWPVDLIAPVSLIIFYALYNVLLGKNKYLLLLAIALGFSFHLNFTSIFFPLIVLFSLPFFRWNKLTIKYILISIPLFFMWFIPNIFAELSTNNVHTKNMTNYLQIYYHGFHIRRFFQLTHDAFIEIEGIINVSFIRYMDFFLLPLFAVAYLKRNFSKKNFIMVYLITIWFLVPWLVFSVYRGEISNYYFSLTRPFAIIIISFLLAKIIEYKNIFPKTAIIIILVFYSFYNLNMFFNTKNQGLKYQRKIVEEAINNNKPINFTQGNPQSYIYYIYTRNKK